MGRVNAARFAAFDQLCTSEESVDPMLFLDAIANAECGFCVPPNEGTECVKEIQNDGAMGCTLSLDNVPPEQDHCNRDDAVFIESTQCSSQCELNQLLPLLPFMKGLMPLCLQTTVAAGIASMPPTATAIRGGVLAVSQLVRGSSWSSERSSG